MAKRVLVVDDSNTMRKIIIKSLQSIGIPNAVEASDGTEALRIFQEDSFDLVLTDWNMPGRSGLEFVKEIRKTNATVSIMMVTTESAKTRVLEAIQAGVNDYLVKPFTADLLQEKLERLVAAL